MKIVHLCLANNVNAGDIALRYAAQAEIRRVWPDSEIFCGNLDAISWNDEAIDYLNKTADLIVVGPGGIFLKPVHKETRSGWLWDIDTRLLSRFQKPVFAYSVGFNVFRNDQPEDKFIETMSALVETSSLFTIRHKGGQVAMRSYLANELKSKVDFLFCPTLLYRWDAGEVFKKKNGKKVGVLCAGDRLNLRHKDLESYFKQIIILSESLKKKGYEVNYISHMPADDWILNYYSRFDNVVKLTNSTIDEIYDTYDQYDYVIGDRGHAQMIGFARGAVMITPVSHDKLKWFYEDVGLNNYAIEENDQQLAAKILTLVLETDLDRWKKKYLSILSRIRNEHDMTMKRLKSIVEQRSEIG